MANVNRVNGLTPYKNIEDGGLTEYFIPSGNATATFIGDLVKLDTTGDTAAAGGLAKGIRSVVQAAAGDAAVGVIVGFKIDPTNLNTPQYRAASAGRYVLVADDPEMLFEIQASGSTAVADVGLNANVTVAAGSTATGNSGMQLDTASQATTATLQLKIVEFSQRQDNDPTSANAKIVVQINNHQLRGGTGTAGV